MASRVEALYRLELIDAEVAEKRDALAHMEMQLDEEEELLPSRRKQDEKGEALRKSRSRLRSLELDLEEISSKIASTEKMLYGGEVTNPKELAGLEQELEYLKRRQSDVEDRTLVMMAEVEEMEGGFKEGKEFLERTERAWEAAQGNLHREAEELRSRLMALEGERRERLLTVSKEDLSAYEDVRRQKGGQAVAVLEKGICQGCRVALPTSFVQKVRLGQDLVYCGSCQRLLYSLP